jgi:hypothetical protein
MADTKQPVPRSSICLVRVWHGNYPSYLGCFLRSCAANPDIHWLVITDNPIPPEAPANVRFHCATAGAVLRRFTSKLGFEPAPPEVNTDLKAALGFVFDDLLAGYDFWGQCDFDMIFGDLRKFLTEDILIAHDKILCRGHLTLYRNTEKVNRAFMLDCPGALNYRDVFRTPGTTQFDEMKGVNLIFRYHGLPQFHGEFIVDVLPPTRWKITRFAGAAIQNYPEQVFYWHQGKVFHAHYNRDCDLLDDEYAYIHFQKRLLAGPSFDPMETDGFLITPDGFFPYHREPLTGDDFARYNREHWRPRKELLRALRGSLGRRLGLVPPDHLMGK